MSKLILSYLFKTNLATFRSAIIDDDTDKICRMLDIQRDYISKNIDTVGNTALLLAIDHASTFTVRLLLEQGAQPDQPNGITSQTALDLLASKAFEDYNSNKAQRALEIAKILLDKGAFVDKPSPHLYRDESNQKYPGKETPLMTAVRQKNLPMAKLFIERKSNVNYYERHSKIRSIHFAITNGDEPMFDLLESAGASCDSLLTTGDDTLLHWFCSRRDNDQCSSLLMKLIKRGCDINAENCEQRTPLFVAAHNDMVNTCRILLRAGAVANKVDSRGHRPVDVVPRDGQCLTLLRQHSTSTKMESPSGVESPGTPIITFLRKHRLRGVRRHTADLNDLKSNGTDSLSLASKPSVSQQDTTDGEQTSVVSGSSNIQSEGQQQNGGNSTSHDRMWNKMLDQRRKRQAKRVLSQQRAQSLNTEN